MKKVLIFMLCALMLTSCAVLGTLAAEETTAEETTTATEDTTAAPTFDPLHIVFNSSLTGKKNIVEGANGLGKGGLSKTDAWEGYKIVISETDDPHMGVNYGAYIKKTENQPVMIENTPFIVIRVLAEEILFDDFEIYYCAGDVVTFTEDCKTASDIPIDNGNGELFFIFDLTDDAQGTLNSLRIDITGAEEDAEMYITDIALFATEDDALNWCGYEEPETQETEPQETETEAEVTTPAEDEEIQTAPPANTDDKKDGCGSVLSAGLVTVSMIALGAVCIKKKD